MNLIFGLVVTISMLVLVFINPEAILSSMLGGGQKALELTLKLVVIYAVWMGIFELFEKTGLSQKLSKDFDEEENEQLEYEPIFLDNLFSSNIRKTYIQAILENQSTITEKTISYDLDIMNNLPDSFFGENAVKNVLTDLNNIVTKIKDTCNFAENLVFNDNATLLVKQIPDNTSKDTSKDWILSGELTWYNNDFAANKSIKTLELSNSFNVLSGYITSLILLASQPEEDNCVYDISLYAVKSDGTIPSPEQFQSRPADAREILNKIYYSMFIEQFDYCVPETLIQTELSLITKKKRNNPFNRGFT